MAINQCPMGLPHRKVVMETHQVGRDQILLDSPAEVEVQDHSEKQVKR
jgi:hypothetical protein